MRLVTSNSPRFLVFFLSLMLGLSSTPESNSECHVFQAQGRYDLFDQCMDGDYSSEDCDGDCGPGGRKGKGRSGWDYALEGLGI